MSVNVDTVYQTVQALANKEQRGYLTPQEFNLFANQAQQDMFEQYFYDLNAFGRETGQVRTIGDSITHIQHKIINTDGVTVSNSTACTFSTPHWTIPSGNLTGRIFYATGTSRRELKILPGHIEDLLNLKASKWHKKGSDEIWYFEDGWNRIQVHDINGPVTTGITCESVSGKPGLVFWGYMIVNEKATYNPTTSSHFDLHKSEQPDLVIKILKLAGISIEDSQLAGIASQEEQLNLQQESK